MSAKADPRFFEIVLPVSGKFARIRPILWRDWLVSVTAKELAMPALASRICTLDGHTHTLDEWMEFEFEDIQPVVAEINRRFSVMTGKGVA